MPKNAPADELPTASAVGELHEILTRTGQADVLTLQSPRRGDRLTTFVAMPEGRTLTSLRALFDEFREHPERRIGTATLQDVLSFIAHVQRFSDTGGQLICFADPSPTKPSFTAIYDYHQAAGEGKTPGWLQHRAVFACRMSPEWLAWQAINGKPMDQGAFAEFLEDRIQDVVLVDTAQEPKLHELVQLLNGTVGGASAIMALSRGLAVSRNIKVRQAVTLASGEVAVQYEEQHGDESGQPIKAPNLFFIGIPVFYAADPYRIAVRLRYRITPEGKLLWSCHLHRPDLVFEDAFGGLRRQIEDHTEAAILIGTPEV